MSNFTVVINPMDTCKMANKCSKADKCERAKTPTNSKMYCYEFETFDGRRPSEFKTSSDYKILHG